MALFLTILQLGISLIIGAYFFRQLRKERVREQRPQRLPSPESEKLLRMRAIQLSEPLNERVRPRSFEEIVGQEEGIRALRSVLCGENPQHVLIYGPPGVGKTCAARLALEAAKHSPGTPFRSDAPFIEMDATCVRFDERAIADPLIGSVHDPIYQGAGPLGQNGVPQPKEGAVTRAHGGVLFLDEIGELHPIQMNKLLKVLEDRKVLFESAYYNPNDRATPRHIHDIFQNGLPADFRLIGATTRSPEDLPPALRSRCMEIYFRPLDRSALAQVAQNASVRAGIRLSKENALLIAGYSESGRAAVNLVQLASAEAHMDDRNAIERQDIEFVAETARYIFHPEPTPPESGVPGLINALAVFGGEQGAVLRAEAFARPGSGELTVTGVIESEEMGNGRGHTFRRQGMAMDSARAAKTALSGLGMEMERYNVHINFPGGAPVDGPSAGLAMACAMHSAITGIPADGQTAMTGEISVKGYVLPVGGVPAKVRAAERMGLRRVLVPLENLRDVRNTKIEIVPVRTLQEALSLLHTTILAPVASGERKEGVLAARGI